MDREDARRWVAEHVMGMQRKPCEAGERYWHTAGAFDAGYVSESGFWCRWCGRKVRDGEAEPCPEYPFAHFDLVQLMRRLAEEGLSIGVSIDKDGKFYISTREHVTQIWGFFDDEGIDDPFGDLCKWLVQRYNSDDDQD